MGGNSWVAAILAILLMKSFILRGKGQTTISTSCSSSMITSFTPCLNFVTGSSSGGASPTQECCNALKTLTLTNMDCACLIITGNVPVSIPFINANLGISLPRACKSSVPLQCKASGVPLPAPGPVLFGPPPPPAAVPVPAPAPAHVHAPAPAPLHSHAHSPKGSKAASAAVSPEAESLDISPAPSSPSDQFPLGPGANPGIRPVVNHSSSPSNVVAIWKHYLVLMFGGIIAFKFF